jgi:hypothetical protein
MHSARLQQHVLAYLLHVGDGQSKGNLDQISFTQVYILHLIRHQMQIMVKLHLRTSRLTRVWESFTISADWVEEANTITVRF